MLIINVCRNGSQVISDILIGLISGFTAGGIISVAAWGFGKSADEFIYRKPVHRALIAILNETTLFIQNLASWQKYKDSQLSQIINSQDPQKKIDFCLRLIEKLSSIKITVDNVDIFIKYLQSHVVELEKIIALYNNYIMLNPRHIHNEIIDLQAVLSDILLIYRDPSSQNNKYLMINEKFAKDYKDCLKDFLNKVKSSHEDDQKSDIN